MTQIQTFKKSSFEVQCICVKGDAWFKGKDIANILGYKNAMQVVGVNVDEDERNTLCDLLAIENQGVLSGSIPPKSIGLSDSTLDSHAKKTNPFVFECLCVNKLGARRHFGLRLSKPARDVPGRSLSHCGGCGRAPAGSPGVGSGG